MRQSKVKMVASLLLLLLLTACGQATESKESSIYQVEEVQNCRVTQNQLDVKSGAGDSFQTIGTVNKGDELTVLGQVGDWYVVQLDNNRVGCIESAGVKPIVKENTPSSSPQTTQLPQQPQQPQASPQPQPQANSADKESAQANGNEAAMEQEMVNLVNQERQKNNLPALKVDPEITRVARIKSQDMVDNDYFSHNSPTYGSPFDMMRNFGIRYMYAGENLALNSTVKGAHEGLMGSAGHRQNILNPNFTHIGIGVKPKNRNSYIFTQMFVGKPE